MFVCDGERPSLEDVVMHTCQSSRWRSAFDDFGAPFVHVDPNAYAAAAGSVGSPWNGWWWTILNGTSARDGVHKLGAAGLVAWTGRLAPEDRADLVDDVISAYAEVSGSE